jgi:hypothetical protein
MKKSFFGFGAKVAMAVLAVCSFVLTSCYEKTPLAKTPSEYYVIGTVYGIDADGNYKLLNNATVTVDGKTVSNPFNVKLDTYKTAVAVTATADGYVAGSRTVAITKLAEFNQVSTTNADLVLVPETVEEPSVPALQMGEKYPAEGMTAEAIASMYGITGEDEVLAGDNGLVKVSANYSFNSDMHSNRHPNFDGHVNHTNGITHEAKFVEDSAYVGYVAKMDAGLADYAEAVEYACITDLNSPYVGTEYNDFKKEGNYVPFATVLNRDGGMCLAGYSVCKEFTLWTIPFSLDGTVMNVMALQAIQTTILPIEATNHDHVNDGANAWGGGAGE